MNARRCSRRSGGKSLTIRSVRKQRRSALSDSTTGTGPPGRVPPPHPRVSSPDERKDCQLYTSKRFLVETAGFEPLTPCVKRRRPPFAADESLSPRVSKTNYCGATFRVRRTFLRCSARPLTFACVPR
jgi:hypothetical protein